MTAVEDYETLYQFAYDQVDMFPHYGTLTEYARQCRTIIEWGVRGGVSTWAFLEGLPQDGHLWSVDILDCVVPRPVSSDPRWTFVIGDDLDPAVQAQLPTKVDLVFIDTSHTYGQTYFELIHAASLLPVRIVMHDYVMDPVRRAADRFCSEYGWRVTAMEEPYGLATLERVT